MIRPLALPLLLAACAAPESPKPPEPPFRACLAIPAPLPPVRTVEALKGREKRLEVVALDCAARLDAVVKAWPR